MRMYTGSAFLKVALIVGFCNSLSPVWAEGMYDHQAAAEYARMWWQTDKFIRLIDESTGNFYYIDGQDGYCDHVNTAQGYTFYYRINNSDDPKDTRNNGGDHTIPVDPSGEYGDWGFDCANFISQCLIAGGLKLNGIGQGGTITNVRDLDNFLNGGQAAAMTINASDDWQSLIPNDLAEGDVLFFYGNDNDGAHEHATIAIGGTGKDIILAAHSSDENDGSIAQYFSKPIFSQVKIFRINKCQDCDDNDKCTIDFCDPEKGCQHIPFNLGKCQYCENGVVKNKECSSPDNCHTARCDPATGSCIVEPKALSKCELCINGAIVCKDCDDGDPCTEDRCDPVTGACENKPIPGCDQPDDNYDVGDGPVVGADSVDANAKIALLDNGFSVSAGITLAGLHQKYWPVRYDDIPASADTHSVLFIPSGGLSGLDNSPTFRQKLAAYAASGGTIIVLAQQLGYEFGALPGTLSAYGWTEDMSCQWASAYMDTYHQILSGLVTQQPSIVVDGYFTKWPENAQILLRRTKNSMPCMLMYPYGSGRVIVTTLYEDFAYTHGQSTADGTTIVRDMLAWAKEPVQLEEFKAADTVKCAIQILNDLDRETGQIRITVLTPDVLVHREEVIARPLAAGDSATIDVVMPPVGEDHGIWYVNYELVDDQGVVIQPNALAKRFAVADPPPAVTAPALAFDITSNAEYYAAGSPGVFSIHVRNNCDTARTISAYYWLPHHLWATNNSMLYGTSIWDGEYSTLHQTVVVPPHSDQTMTVSAPLITTDRLWVRFYDEENKDIGSSSLGFYVFAAKCKVTASTDNTDYMPGDMVSLTITAENVLLRSYDGKINILVSDPNNNKIWADSISATLQPNTPVVRTFSFAVPSVASSGAYSIRLNATSNGKNIGSVYKNFAVPEIMLSVIPHLPAALCRGDNVVKFAIENHEMTGITSGVVHARLLNPSGNTIWSDTCLFSFDAGPVAEANFVMPVSTVDFGAYTLCSYATYKGLTTKEARKELPSTSIVSVTANKSSYAVREPVSIDLAFTNTGVFRYEALNYRIQITESGSKAGALTLNPGQNIHVPFSFTIPETWGPGSHQGSVEIMLPSGSSITKNFTIEVPPYKFSITCENTAFAAGDSAGVGVENTGGVDANVHYRLELKGRFGIVVFSKEGSMSIAAGKKDSIGIIIPIDIDNGPYSLSLAAFDQTGGDTIRAEKTLIITGLTAQLALQTDKRTYDQSENATALADISVVNGKIVDGSLGLSVSCLIDTGKLWSTEADWQTVALRNAEIAYDGQGNVLGIKPIQGNIEIPHQGIVAYWDFNEGAGDTLHDISGNGHYGTIYDAEWGTTEERQYLKFNGYTSYVEVAYNDSLDNPDNFTLAAWAKSDVPDYYEDAFIVDMGYGAERRYALSYHPYLGANGAYCASSIGTFNVDITQWHHYAMTYDGSTLKYYIDGDLIGIIDRGPGDIDDLPFRIGTQSKELGRYWQGSIDEVIMYNRAITTEEVQQLSTPPTESFFTARYDAGKTVVWAGVQWLSVEAESTAVKVAARMAESEENLDTARWSAFSDAHGLAPISGSGRWIDIKAMLKTTDPVAKPVILQNLSVSYAMDSALWKNDIPVNCTESQRAAVSLGSFTRKGRYSLDGQVSNTLHQILASQSYAFFIGLDSVSLTFSKDNDLYKPEDSIRISGVAINRGASDIIKMPLVFTIAGFAVYRDSITVLAGTNRSFSFAFTAPEKTSLLTASFNGSTYYDKIEIERPAVSAEIIAPSIVGSSPFNFDVRLTNNSMVDAAVTVSIGWEESQSVVIPKGESVLFEKPMSLSYDETIYVAIRGDVTLDFQKYIQFGEYATISVKPQSTYAEGVVIVPYSIQNTGLVDADFDLTFTLAGETIKKNYYISSGQTVEDALTFNQPEGTYSLSYSSRFGSGIIYYSVAKANQVAMQLQVARYKAPNVLILRDNNWDQPIKNMLEAEGMHATISDSLFFNWNGTAPSLAGFDIVFMPCPYYFFYGQKMDSAGQKAIVDFVSHGGGFITSEYSTYFQTFNHLFDAMGDVLLFDPAQWSFGWGYDQIFTKVGIHPITNDLPASFSITSWYHYGNSGGLKPGAQTILTGSVLPNAVAVKQYGKGRIVQFAFEISGLIYLCQSDTSMKKLLINSLSWAGKSFESANAQADLTLTNNGNNTIDGKLYLASEFYSKTDDIILTAGESIKKYYTLDVSAVESGTYNFKASVINDGMIIQQVSKPLEIGGAELALSPEADTPSYTLGQLATMSIGVKNTGIIEGNADVHFKVLDLFEGDRQISVAPGMEQIVDCKFEIPADLPSGLHAAVITLNDEEVELPFFISGIKIDVTALLDKTLYLPGDTALMTLHVINQGSTTSELESRVSSGDYSDTAVFTLDTANTFSFTIPVNTATPDKIFYGIYTESGRGIYLNSQYIRVAKGPVTVYTEKGVYQSGDSVKVLVNTAEAGDLQVSTSTGYSVTMPVNGFTQFTFKLPDQVVSGTYSIRYLLNQFAGTSYFDVNGISAKVLELALDTNRYGPIDSLHADITIEANQAVSTILKGWIYGPDQSSSECFEVARDLTTGRNRISVSGTINASSPGIYRLVYGLYQAGASLSLVAGSKAFDVREASITCLSTSKETYGEAEEVNLLVTTYACASYSGRLEALINGISVAGKEVLLSGTAMNTLNLGRFTPGRYSAMVRLRADQDIMTEKQISFSIVDNNAPTMPSGLAVALQGGTAELSWNANTEPDLDGYFIYCNGTRLNSVPVKSNRYWRECLVAGINFVFHITAVDRAGNESEPSGEVRAMVDNSAPVITMSLPIDVKSSEPVTLTYSVTDDIDAHPVIIADYPSPTTFSKSGIYTVTVSAEDQSGNRSSKSITITIISNRPPFITAISDTVIDEGTTLAFTVAATDQDNDALNLSSANLPIGATFNTLTGAFSWSPTYNQAGSYPSIIFTACDQGSPTLCAHDTLFIRVNNVNRPPIASAGNDQTIHTGSVVLLNGNSSSDPDNDYPLHYSWHIALKPERSHAELMNADKSDPTFYADAAGEYAIELTVTDSAGLAGLPDTVIASTYNSAPLAEAGPDQSVITLGTNVILDGTKSWDIDGDPLVYQWTFMKRPSGSIAELIGNTAATPSFIADVHGEYAVGLIVSDAWSTSMPDTIHISFDNIKPVANAGVNQAVIAGASVNIDGSASTDANRDDLTYHWAFVSRPMGSTAVLSRVDTVTTEFIADSAGEYILSLTVNDGFINSDPSNVTVVATTNSGTILGILRMLMDSVNKIPDNCWKNPNNQKAFTNKISSVIKQVDQGTYADAINQLGDDIKQKTNGCAETGAPDKNDWLLCCEAQNTIYPLIQQAIWLLRKLL
jgi:hypothetical protein